MRKNIALLLALGMLLNLCACVGSSPTVAPELAEAPEPTAERGLEGILLREAQKYCYLSDGETYDKDEAGGIFCRVRRTG